MFTFILTVASALSLLIWIYLTVGHGGFWRVSDESAPVGEPPARRVAIVIPARNEADTIGRTVCSLVSQDYAGTLSIIVVDDHSTDGTGARAAAASDRVTVVNAAPLPSGWTGKMWAVAQGLDQALATAPDYVLLTDGDIEHAPDSVRALVARAERDGLDLTSYMVRLKTGNFAERVTIPAFVFFFLKLYPPARIASSASRVAGAAGGCMLVRATALERIGRVERIRGEIIDDCALARQIKASGGRLWLGLTARTRSLRRYADLAEISDMIARTAFTQLHHSVLLLAGTVAGMALIYLAPPVAVLSGSWLAMAFGGPAWLLLAGTYIPMLRFYGRSPLWAPLLPLVAMFYTGATLESAIRYWMGRGGAWKGRVQDGKRN